MPSLEESFEAACNNGKIPGAVLVATDKTGTHLKPSLCDFMLYASVCLISLRPKHFLVSTVTPFSASRQLHLLESLWLP
jgi:hypothetical protein